LSKRLLIAVIAAAAVFAVVGLAASMDVFSDSLGAGSRQVDACTTSVNVSYVVDEGVVTQVLVKDIPNVCVGTQLSLTLADASGSALVSFGPVTVPPGSPEASVTFDLATEVPAGSIAKVHVAMVGAP
jgi:archaellin